MKNSFPIFLLLVIILTSFIKASENQKAQILESYGKIPLAFTANTGQIDSQV